MDLELCKQLPPTAVFTSEFDFLRGDALLFAEKLEKAGKLLGLQDMPGGSHGYEHHFQQPESHQFQEEYIKAFKKWVRD